MVARALRPSFWIAAFAWLERTPRCIGAVFSARSVLSMTIVLSTQNGVGLDDASITCVRGDRNLFKGNCSVACSQLIRLDKMLAAVGKNGAVRLLTGTCLLCQPNHRNTKVSLWPQASRDD